MFRYSTKYPAEFLPEIKFYISYINTDRNMGTSLKMQKVSKFPLVHVPFRFYANRVKTFLDQQFRGKWVGQEVLSHGLPGHQIWSLWIFCMRIHKKLGVPNEGARCGQTANPNNCSLWDCYTSDATKHLTRGGVSCGHLSGHRGRTRRQYWGKTKLGNFLHLSEKFRCLYLYLFRKYKMLLLVEVLPGIL
jgi:hypothetical protein